VEAPEARIYKLNEEHGHVDFREAASGRASATACG
jgi:hypothetical protein